MCVLTDRWSFGTTTVANSSGFLMMEWRRFLYSAAHPRSLCTQQISQINNGCHVHTRAHLSSVVLAF